MTSYSNCLVVWARLSHKVYVYTLACAISLPQPCLSQSSSQTAHQPAGAILVSLVNKYAPQLMHPHDEPNLPANVEWLLDKVHLTFHNSECPEDDKDLGVASLTLLETAQVTSACSKHTFHASGTRSADRSRTFVLTDVADTYKRGLQDPGQWTTYYHAYRNSESGWTIQYWTFYAFNTGQKLGPIELGYHGGDWEMVAVVLGPDDLPTSVQSTGHTSMHAAPWSTVEKNGTHPIVYTERGGHEVHTNAQSAPPYIVHPTWAGAMANIPGTAAQIVGPLVDLGSKLHPNARFLLYSGLWGSLGATPFSSGYWGPVFNETGMTSNGFLAAWCDGIVDPSVAENGIRECYADDPE